MAAPEAGVAATGFPASLTPLRTNTPSRPHALYPPPPVPLLLRDVLSKGKGTLYRPVHSMCPPRLEITGRKRLRPPPVPWSREERPAPARWRLRTVLR